MNEELVENLRDASRYMAGTISTLKNWVPIPTLLTEAANVIEKRSKPRWIPVTEALPESIDDDVLVTDGEGCAVGYWRPDAQAWDSTDFGWLENRSEPPCGIHTVTHWMPLPPLPEPPKEEEPDVQSKI